MAINENRVVPNNMRLYLMGARLNALARMNVFLGEGIAETITSAKSNSSSREKKYFPMRNAIIGWRKTLNNMPAIISE